MREQDIRAALRLEIEKVYGHEDGTLVIEELGLCEGDARIDIAVVNGALIGYEIKSEADTLQRLPHQSAVYSRLMDQVTVVSSGSHLEKAKRIIPEWWGLTEAVDRDGAVEFNIMRQPKNNPKIDAFSLAQLLWRDEALGLLRQFGMQKGMGAKSRHDIWKKLCEITTIEQLSDLVRRQLRSREMWRSVRTQELDDDSCRPVAR